MRLRGSLPARCREHWQVKCLSWRLERDTDKSTRQVLCTRIRPSAVANSSLLPILLCRNRGSRTPSRPATTAQASRLPIENNIPPGMLSRKRSHLPLDTSSNYANNEHPTPAEGRSQSRPQPRAQAHSSSSNNNRQRSASSTGRVRRGGKYVLKRKMVDPSQQPAKRRHVEPSTPTNLPLLKDCPGLSRKILANPKEEMYNKIHNSGLGQLRSAITSSGRDLYSCTLSCMLGTHSEPIVVFGEGVSKVGTT